MYYLENARYQMIMRLGGDIWALHGNVFGRDGFSHEYLTAVSTPTSFDDENDVLTTYSGSVYKINSYYAPRDKVVEQIKKDIDSGYETH